LEILSFIFGCKIAYQVKWHIISDKRSEDKEIQYDNVIKLFPINTPHIPHWQRFGGYYFNSRYYFN